MSSLEHQRKILAQQAKPVLPLTNTETANLDQFCIDAIKAGAITIDVEKLPSAPHSNSPLHLIRQLFLSKHDTATGLEHLDLFEFLAVAREKRAFYFATETALRAGTWNSLMQKSLIKAPEAQKFQKYLRGILKNVRVVEIGAGDKLAQHRGTVRRLGAESYIGIDLQDLVLPQGGLKIDALEFFAQMPQASVDVIMAFGVFNEPMSLMYPAGEFCGMLLPARSPAKASRRHCEHEYVRRLATAMHKALSPNGLLFGDGIHSRGFETDVPAYLRRAGFDDDLSGFEALLGVDAEKFNIRNPFFFRKLES